MKQKLFYKDINNRTYRITCTYYPRSHCEWRVRWRDETMIYGSWWAWSVLSSEAPEQLVESFRVHYINKTNRRNNAKA